MSQKDVDRVDLSQYLNIQVKSEPFYNEFALFYDLLGGDNCGS
ncbi:hypothetical protein HMPREF0536_10120 [Limosilactobacillus reuteri MM4-1A]|uniref:Uncharacterized protein n=1 Tax=Limosilactobacillus reuteri MM4-1A TaxID=548485 RepID=A0A828RHA9_LIMRT|nr:hypothetical protein HMPREF0535_1884 [Limosilactobacillus reuteri MM2-3]EGC15940.1 hypothetical protein HMPREF0536_10120 [Limosilactobacillus reuteri MM4-1A]